MKLKPEIPGWRVILRWYKASAIILLNLLALFFLVNFGVFSAYEISRHLFPTNPLQIKYGSVLLKQIYPDLSEEEGNELLNETWSRNYVYEPFTQFKEAPYRGKYVNVDEHGFRYTRNEGPWPPDPNAFNVFMFGGSTTFGYGVPDWQTTASYLQEDLVRGSRKDVRVYNFGRGYYYSTQERILFERFLTSGSKPDVAIFVDGLNEFIYTLDEPIFTVRLQQFVEGKLPARALLLISRWPVYRAAQDLNTILMRVKGPAGHEEAAAIQGRDQDNPVVIENSIHRYQANRKIIEAVAAAHGVRAIFVWQPIPFYKYDLKYHPFSPGVNMYAKFGYAAAEELGGQRDWGSNFLWCAAIQEGVHERLYVDFVHYSGKMSKKLSGCIFQLISERHLLHIQTR